MQIPPECLRLVVEQGVNQSKELHDALVAAEVLVACALISADERSSGGCLPFNKKVKSVVYDLMTSFLGSCLDARISTTGWNESMKA